MADHGFAVAGYDKDAKQVATFAAESKGLETKGFTDIKEFIQSEANFENVTKGKRGGFCSCAQVVIYPAFTFSGNHKQSVSEEI